MNVIDYYNLDERDQKTWELVCSGRTKGVFQLDSNLGQSWAKRLQPIDIQEMSDLSALLRPGAMNSIVDDKSMTQHYVDRKMGIELDTPIHPALHDILKDTYQILVYQEQSMAITKELAGFTLEQADDLRKCVAEGSWVYTQGGPRKIENITKLSKILTFDKNGKLIYRKIKKVWSTGKQKVYRVYTHNGYNIEVTDNHQFFTQRGWVDCKNLNQNDFVIIPNNYSFKGSNGKLDENLAILISYFIGEGYYKDCKITNSDKWIIDLILRILKEYFGEDSYRLYYQKNGCVDIFLKGKAKEWMFSKCESGKSRYKKIPDSILHGQNGITRAFIGSYFSGEGSVSKDGLDISSTSKEIIECLQALLLRDGIHSAFNQKNGIYKNEPYISYRITISSMSEINKFKNYYKEYICPTKLKAFDNFNFEKRSNIRFLVPSCFIKPLATCNNFNAIIGNVGGSRYTQNLTYDYAEFINSMIDNKLLDDILKYQYRFVRIKKIEYVDEKETYDFEVEGDYHYGFINGICVHNSIGKKSVEGMKKCETQFIEGCKKTNIIDNDAANKIFDIIRESQKYQFNASHSVSYSKVGYWTAYMKANHTTTFLCASMNHLGSLDPKDTLRALILEAKSYGIPVYPPSIKSQNTRFSLKDGAIYFGLTAIKDVGETGVVALQTLVAETGKKIEELSWPELLLIIYKVSIKTVEPLISVGYFDFLNIARIKLLEEYKVFCKLNDSVLKQYKVILENNPDYKTLIDVLNRCVANYDDSVTFGHKKPFNVNIYTKLKDIITLLIQSSIDNDSVDWICRKERELLGIELTYSKLDKCEAVASNTNCAKIREFGGENLAFAAEVCSVREYTIKEGKNCGQVMAFVTVSDQTGYLDSVVFSGLYSTRKNMFYEGNTVFIHGKIGDKGSLIIEGVKEI